MIFGLICGGKVVKYVPGVLDDASAIADISEPQLFEAEYYNISCALFPSKKLFIRKCYKDLLPRFLDPAVRKTFITGSPGVGKTCFLLFLLKALFEQSENKEQLKILTNGLIPGVDFVCFDHEKALILATDEAWDILCLGDPNLICFADSSFEFDWVGTKLFLFVSLKKYEEYCDKFRSARAIFMPPWSLEELLA